LTEVVVSILAGRPVDVVVRTSRSDLRIRGVPRWAGHRPVGGLIVVSPGHAQGPGRGTVVDLRDDCPVEAVARHGGAVREGPAPVPEAQRAPGPTWLRRSPGGARRRPVAGRGDEHAATHDVLTGLPNQVLAVQCLADALATCESGRRVGVLAVETTLDEDSTGGTDLLRDVGERLGRLVGPGDVAARLEGPRFAMVLRDVRPGSDVERFLHQVHRRLDGVRVDDGGGEGGRGGAVSPGIEGLGMVLADPVSGTAAERDPRLVLALALEAMERSRLAGRPVVGTELPADAERARLAALSEYDLYDIALDDALQGIAQVALTTCDALTSLVTFVDSDLQWVRAGSGGAVGSFLDARGPRHLALCDRTIRGREVLVVPDTEADPDFLVSRHVAWQVGMRFYAGAPLVTGEGRSIGTLCVFDRRPRDLSERQRRSLAVLAAETVALLDAHRVPRDG